MADTTHALAGGRRPLPNAAKALLRAGEPLWIASLAALFVVWGYSWIPRAIRMLGRAGQTETVEWAVYMSLLVGFPSVAVIIAVALPRVARGQAQGILKACAVVFALWIAFIFTLDGRLAVASLALVPALLTAIVEVGPARLTRNWSPESMVRLGALVVVGMISWMCTGALVYWTHGSSWFIGSVGRILGLAVATGLALLGLPRLGERDGTQARGMGGERIASFLALAVIVVFSFRTNPVVEFYHWGFWTGPIEQLRQGGSLLRDTPSQYGFLSILIPTAMPGSAWLSFWFFQSVIYAFVSATMFIVLRRMRRGFVNLLLSFAVVFTTLFFRPRSASLLLPAQMTPSGGPVRFLWCFVLLVWLLSEFERRKSGNDNRGRFPFPLTGHIIWLCAVAWSFEAAIYCSAIWFAAFAIHLVQQASVERMRAMRPSSIARRLVVSAATPFVMMLALYGVVWLIYKFTLGVPPDLAGYVEYGVLYSRGFGALPIDPTGAVWYLLLVFFIASTAAVMLLIEDWRDFRLVVAAGVWGGIWSVSSYFVSRSHPANLLSILPVLLFALTILVVSLKDSLPQPWHAYVRTALVPVFVVPVALTLGHPSLLANLRVEQLPLSKFTAQIAPMDQELETLMREAGAKPGDPVVRIVDGRLVMPPWRGTNGDNVMSEKSWLPKPYEIIGTLSAERRQVYIDRDAAKPIGGWMIQHQSDTVRWFGDHLKQILRTHEPARKFTRGPWSLWWMVPRPRPED